jgi:hypothetical protein
LRRYLWLIDLTLLGLSLLTVSVLRDRWDHARQREEALLRRTIAPAPAPPMAALPGVTPSRPEAYMNVAQELLLSRDRNSTVILDPPPPPPAPKPMPPLPLAYGVINLGNGPTLIMSEKQGAQHRGYRVGEKVGAFTLVAINGQEIIFDWEGKQVSRRLDEIIDKKALEAKEPPPEQPQAVAAKPAQAVTSLGKTEAGPGVELGSSSRACVPGDTTPAGTVKDGYRKVVNKTPFGDSCRWEAVK